MDQHNADAHLVKDCQLLNQRPCAGRVGKHFAAGLDDEDLASIQPHIGRCMAQRRHNDIPVLWILNHQAPAPSI